MTTKRNRAIRLGLMALVSVAASLALDHGGRVRCLASGPPSGLASSMSEEPSARVFYVSTQGNDAWSGTLPLPDPERANGPFRTLARARDAARELKHAGSAAVPVTIFVRGGVYELTQPLVFVPEDSGTPEAPVTYAAYPGETPLVSGGRRITGWRRPGRGTRLTWPAPAEVWMAEVPEAASGKWRFHQLFINGQPRSRARSPNTGFYTVDGEITPDKPARFKFREGDIRAAWAERGDVEVVALLKWAEFRMPIRAVDEAARSVTLTERRQVWGDEKDARYWVENAPDALDAPGEWYLDRDAGQVFYVPLPGEDLSHAEIVAPVLETLIRFDGDAANLAYVHDITIRGLRLNYTDWAMPPDGYVDMQAAYDRPAAVEGRGARSCTIEKCVFAHLGQYAIAFGEGSKRNRVVGNEMSDLGAGGVKIGDPKETQEEQGKTSGNIVASNRIHDIGRVFPAAVGIWVGESSDNTIAHNEIFDTFYTGISVGWTWGYGPTAARGNTIELNKIFRIGRGLLSDLGCIYTLGVQPGTVERNNLCHDVTRYERGYGGWGIYADEGSSNILIEDNVVYRTQDGGFHQHYGHDNILRNNVFAFGQEAQLRRTRAEPHRSFRFEHNIVYWKSGKLLDGKWGDGGYEFDYNLYYCEGGEVRFLDWRFEGWQKRSQDAHSLVGDPLFTAPERGDFSLRFGSPASRIGFRPIDMKPIGPEPTLEMTDRSP